jgi:23S rRNA (pseudouridine1915-N3)-methyltransferase
VKLKVAWIGRTREAAIQSLTSEYLKRISRYAEVEVLELRSEAALLQLAAGKSHGKQRHALILLDSPGKQMSSEALADFLQEQMTRALPAVFAVGPADGFTAEARASANTSISLGKMTLPHELARVVLLEQLYRAFTILQGHPYHSGH